MRFVENGKITFQIFTRNAIAAFADSTFSVQQSCWCAAGRSFYFCKVCGNNLAFNFPDGNAILLHFSVRCTKLYHLKLTLFLTNLTAAVTNRGHPVRRRSRLHRKGKTDQLTATVVVYVCSTIHIRCTFIGDHHLGWVNCILYIQVPYVFNGPFNLYICYGWWK